MRALVIKDGVAVNCIEVNDLNVIPGLIRADSGNIGDLYDGTVVTSPTKEYKKNDKNYVEKVTKEYVNALQNFLDAKAQEYRYDNIHTACGWAGSFDDAQVLKEWGAACWIVAGKIEKDVLSGDRELLPVEKFLEEMPEFPRDKEIK
jgi:hypothetical protein